MITQNGTSLPFDKLLIATGADPRPINAEGLNLKNAEPSGKKPASFPGNVHRETSEAMHRTHMGVDNDWVSILLHAMRNALSDGWGGSMIATEVSDILFGVPQPNKSTANIGVLQEDKVNIVVHGHNPVVSETVVAACNAPELLKLAAEKGAKGINLVGVCCTGNELMMRHGLPMAGNHLMTELVLVTGAVEMMIVDYQCIMPSIGQTAACYHTKMISTSEKAKFPGMAHHWYPPENAYQKAEELVKAAVENFTRRNKKQGCDSRHPTPGGRQRSVGGGGHQGAGGNTRSSDRGH